MRTLFCIFATLFTTVITSPIDVDKTVKQVQNILETNLHLPRLTREEIIELLNDIKAEDSRNNLASNEISKEYDELKTSKAIDYTRKENTIELTTTTESEPEVMVILPYTPRDGSSLQELYTKPPRTEIFSVSKLPPKPFNTNMNKKKYTAPQKNDKKEQKKLPPQIDFPKDLQAFLNAHGIKNNNSLDNFLLPLEGFKPLPDPKPLNDNVELPENIILTYELIPTHSKKPNFTRSAKDNFLFEPLKPVVPLELETAYTELKEIFLSNSLSSNKSENSKEVVSYEPIDYDSVKVIPLQKGPNPLSEEKATLENEFDKRQAQNLTVNESDITLSETTSETTATTETLKDAITNAPANNTNPLSADTDTGASVSELEESFGGSAPEVPGDSQLPPPKKNGFYWMLDWNSFLEVGDGDNKVNIRFEPKLGDPQMFLPVNVP